MSLDFSPGNMDALIKENQQRSKDKVPDQIVGGVLAVAALLALTVGIANTVNTQRTKLNLLISSCPIEVLSRDVCNKLEKSEAVDIVTPHNISPVCDINPSFEAHQRWTRNVCQLAADRSDLPNLATACTAMQEYTRIVNAATQEACHFH